MANLRLTMALSHYDRHLPFFDGTVRLENVDLTVLEVGQSATLKHGTKRHDRMIRQGEFDICELSLSSYIMAKSRGLPFTAIPVFPRRLFSISQMYIRKDAGIQTPKDLIGRKVGLSTFQTTLSVLAKGDLESEYQVPWRKIHWIVEKEETVPFKPQEGVSIQLMPKGKKIGVMLEQGEINALMMPHPPKEALNGSGKVGRLFSDAKGEELNYFRKNGFYPIMHLVAFKDEVLKKNPWLAKSVTEAFEQAKEICKSYYLDPNWSSMVWGRHLLEEERKLLGKDPWPSGLQRNRPNLERFLGYSQDQGLLEKKLTPEDLFVKESHNS